MSITRWNPALLIVLSIIIPAGIPMGFAVAHPGPQDDPLADAARRAQAEKKNHPAAAKVWTTDDIPKNPGEISIVGTVTPPAAAAAASSAPGTPNSAAKPASSQRNQATIQGDLNAAKLDLNTATTDLDILTRKHVLDSQSYYGKPNYAADTQGATQLQDEQDEIDAKKQQVDDAQKKVNDLQDELSALSSDQGATSDSSSATSTPTTPAPQDAPPSVPSGNSSSPTTIDPNLPTGRK